MTQSTRTLLYYNRDCNKATTSRAITRAHAVQRQDINPLQHNGSYAQQQQHADTFGQPRITPSRRPLETQPLDGTTRDICVIRHYLSFSAAIKAPTVFI